MLNHHKVLFIIFCVVFGASSALAAGQEVPHGKWWLNDRVSAGLKLSDEEIRQLDEKFIESRRKLIDLKSAVEKEKFELEIIMERETTDEAAIMTQFRKLETARSNLAAERFGFVLTVREIIGFERFQQLKAAFKDHRRRGSKKGQQKARRDKSDNPEKQFK